MVKLAGLFILVLSVSVCWGLPQSSTFITNGNDAFAGQFPFFASVVQKLPLINEQIMCGGAIIGEQWILTSGQCVKLLIGKLSVKVGQSNRSNDGEYVQTRQVDFVIIHNQLSGILPAIKENDIALLKLDRPLLMNDRVQKIKLAEDDSVDDKTVVLAGFGSVRGIIPKFPDVLQFAQLEVISNGLCRDAVASVSPANDGRLTDTQLCTGPLDRGVTACFGDIGSPLIRYDKQGHAELVGITSWSVTPCGQKGAPIVYTKVSSFNDWINARVQEEENSELY